MAIDESKAKNLRTSHNNLKNAGFSPEAATKVLLAEIQAEAIKALAVAVKDLSDTIQYKKF